MAKQLCALKVRIGLHDHGHAKYPDFGSLECVKASGQDWSHYIDVAGTGWHYSRCGHKEHADDSPMGMQWGMLLIPAEFAEQATKAFPEDCFPMTEDEVKCFWEDDCHSHMPDVSHQADALTGMSAEIALLKQLVDHTGGDEQVKHAQLLQDALERAKKAVDPDHDHPGVKRNKLKSWYGHKANTGIELA